jgi:glycogen(starch) synthase
MYTSENRNGMTLESAEDVFERIFGNRSQQQDTLRWQQPFSQAPAVVDDPGESLSAPVLAIFCYEGADSIVGQFASQVAAYLAKRGTVVHLFAREGFELADVTVHLVGESTEGDLVDQVQEFARRAGNEFLRLFRAGSAPVTLLGCEWSSVPVMTILHGIKNLNVLWSLYSLERQRSDMTGDLSQRIEEIELSGLRAAKSLLIHDPAAAEVAKSSVPECAERIVIARPVFPVPQFRTVTDPGQIKARYQVGPVDPTILFVGDLNERYGPDLLVKAMPAVLKNHPQARLVIVGDGKLYWPLRVYTRYLLLEHAVRLVGNVSGQALNELIQAADVIALPSRETTPWWPFLAGWAAHRPVVATHQAAPGVLANEDNSVLCYPSENSCVWGLERVLFDPKLGQALVNKGNEKLEELFGWNNVAVQVEELLGVAAAPKA